MRKDLSHLPPAPPVPPEYEEDFQWALKNMDEIAHNYPDQWVAIVNKQVVAAEKSWGRARRAAEKKTGRKEFPIFFVEEDMRFYANQPVV
jgi:hypothetical protein